MNILTASVVALALVGRPNAPPAPRAEPLVSAEWLKAHLKDPDLVVLHVGPAEDYMKAHVPGARFVSLRDLHAGNGHSESELALEMLPADSLRRVLEGIGIGDDSRVVVYFAQEWVSPSTRVLFTLDWAGLGDRASLLDGGIEAWKGVGGATTDVVPEAKRAHLSALRTRPTVVDAAWVNAHRRAKGVRVVDARARAFYDGVDGHERRRGHVAGAGSVPFTEIVDDRNFVLSRDRLAKLFRDAGVAPGDTVVAYCHIGQQATLTLLGARVLGHPVRLYDGSFQDWSMRDLPVEIASPAGRK